MRLIYSPERKRFESLGTKAEMHLPKSAGFRFDWDLLVWFTDDPRAAKLLEDHASPEVRALLNGIPARPRDVALVWSADRKRFELDGPRHLVYERAKAANARWDPERVIWWATDLDVIVALSPWASPEVRDRIERLIEQKSEIREASRAASADVNLPKAAGLEADYYPFQKAGILYALDTYKRGLHGWLCGDEMGLGKTLEALGIVNADETIKRVLVVCPANLKINWLYEAEKWLARPFKIGIGATKRPKKSAWPYVLPGEKLRLGWDPVTFFIVNPDILRQWCDDLRAQEWDLAIFDEAHYYKDNRAIRTQYAFGKRKKASSGSWGWEVPPIPAKRAALLTGTPIVNRPEELFSLIHYCDPAGWPSWYKFAERYCGLIQGSYGTQVGQGIHLDELQDKLRSTIMTRRTKAQVLTELPPKVRQVIELPTEGLTWNGVSVADLIQKEWDTEAKHAPLLEKLRAAVELAKAAEDEHEFREAVDRLKHAASVAFNEVALCRHETVLAKLPLIVAHAKDCLENGIPKLSIFAHHRDAQDVLIEAFYPHVAVVRGGMDVEEKQREVERMQFDPACQVFIGAITTAEGYTLNKTAHCIMAELDWRPGKVSQAEDRHHRIGQQDSVLVQHLVLAGSMDAKMAKTIIAKQRIIDAAMDNEYTVEEADLPAIASETPEPEAREVTSRVRLAAEATLLTEKQIAAIHDGLRLLSGLDHDRAAGQNAVGWSKIDSLVGHDLADQIGLTPRQAALGRKLLTRYRSTQVQAFRPDLIQAIWPEG